MKSILDSAFRYIPSRETDLRKTFERIRREQREQALTGSDGGAKTNVLRLRAGVPLDAVSRASGDGAR